MKPIGSLLAAGAALSMLVLPAAAQQKATLTVITAGDQNMVDYVKDYLGPMFEKSNTNV
jgi:putative spermidine/putrescine transport system substrate-binding protein